MTTLRQNDDDVIVRYEKEKRLKIIIYAETDDKKIGKKYCIFRIQCNEFGYFGLAITPDSEMFFHC